MRLPKIEAIEYQVGNTVIRARVNTAGFNEKGISFKDKEQNRYCVNVDNEVYCNQVAIGKLEGFDILRLIGFTPFYGEGYSNWQDEPLNTIGIRLEVADYVASVWCPLLRYSDVIATEEALKVVLELMVRRENLT